jgi:hypothetical protein
MEIQKSIDKTTLFEFLKSRKPYHQFIYKKVKDEIIKDILECGSQAMIEESNQAFKINVVTHPTVKQMISELFDDYNGTIISDSYADIIVFLDLSRSNNRIIDIQIIGAFMQNVLLAADAVKDLGATLIKNAIAHNEKILEIFKLKKAQYEVMGIISMGAIDSSIEEKILQKEIRSVEEFSDWF